MTKTENSASAATAKPCQISDADHYDLSTATAVDNAFDLAIGLMTDFGTAAGEFTGSSDDKAQLVQLVAAQAGWRDIFRDYQASKAEVARLQSFNAKLDKVGIEQAGLINELLDAQKAHLWRIAELEAGATRAERLAKLRANEAGLTQAAGRARNADTPVVAAIQAEESPEARAERLYAAIDARGGTRIEIRLY